MTNASSGIIFLILQKYTNVCLCRYPIVSPREKCSGDLEHVAGVRSYGLRSADERYDVYCYVDKLRGKRLHTVNT